MSSVSSSFLENVPATGDPQDTLTKASTQIIAKHRLDVIIKAGDLRAFLKERVVDLFTMSNVSASMVILYTLSLYLKAYVEDLFENTTGLDLSSLLPRMRRVFFV